MEVWWKVAECQYVLLFKASNFLGISDDLEFALVGIVLLIGAVVDEVAKRAVTRLRRRREADS